jgi:DNA-binding MarR family transcriptional regulator
METPLSKKIPTGLKPSSLDEHASGRGRPVASGSVWQKRVHSAVTRRSAVDDSPGYRPALSLFSARRAIYRSIGREFAESDFSEIRFETLVTLYSFQPQPATAEKLALHADVSRTRMNEAIADLECRGLVAWSGSTHDRQTSVRLTELGSRFTWIAIHRFLQVASEAAGTRLRSSASGAAELGSRIFTGITARWQPQF